MTSLAFDRYLQLYKEWDWGISYMQKLICETLGNSKDVTRDKVIMLSLGHDYICQLHTHVQIKTIHDEEKGHTT